MLTASDKMRRATKRTNYRAIRAGTETPRDRVRLALDIARNPYAWPGGYARVAVMHDGELLCPACIRENIREIRTETLGDYRGGWQLQGATHTGEFDDDGERCAHCERPVADL